MSPETRQMEPQNSPVLVLNSWKLWRTCPAKEIFLVPPSQGSSVIQLINAHSSSTLHILIPPTIPNLHTSDRSLNTNNVPCYCPSVGMLVVEGSASPDLAVQQPWIRQGVRFTCTLRRKAGLRRMCQGAFFLPTGLLTPRNPAFPKSLKILWAGNRPSASHWSTWGLISWSMSYNADTEEYIY